MAKIPSVNKFSVSKNLFGRYVVEYQCPHCQIGLKSKQEEIGQAINCPTCGESYGISRKASLEILRLEEARREEKREQAEEKQKQEEEKRKRKEEELAAKPKCIVCDAVGTLLTPLEIRDGETYCKTHLDALDNRRRNAYAKLVRQVIVTTTPTLEGYRIVKYLGIDGVEFVTGTGAISEAFTEFADFFGGRSKMFESKLRTARLSAIKLFQQVAVERGANAIVGIDFDYSTFSSNRTAIIVNGTLVYAEPIT